MANKEDKSKKVIRDDAHLLDCVYLNLLKMSTEIMDEDKTNPKMVDAFDSLLATYFDIQEDGF